jgi:ligand-binding sensor domain-containing protein
MWYVRLMLGVFVLFVTLDNTEGQLAERIHKQFRFKFLTVDQGLSHNMVISICQDGYGFIWCGTSNGLNKFDGYQLTNYFHREDDSTTIRGDRIEIVFCDSRKTLWVGTHFGLSTYNYDNNTFVSFRHSAFPGGPGRINDMDEDADGLIWMASWNGLIMYDPQKNIVQHYVHKSEDPSSLPHDNLTNIIIDKDNNPWVSTYNQGVAKFDRKSGTFIVYHNDTDDPETISEDRIETIYTDRAGNVWFGTYNKGMNLFDSGSGKFLRFYPDYTVAGSGRIRAIFEDPRNNFWVGTQTGLYSFSKDTGTFLRYAYTDHPFPR